MKTDHGLPLPTFDKVREVHWHPDSLALIAPCVGDPRRYNTIRLHRDGRARCVGRELTLKEAREAATRSSARDGRPLRESTR